MCNPLLAIRPKTIYIDNTHAGIKVLKYSTAIGIT